MIVQFYAKNEGNVQKIRLNASLMNPPRANEPELMI